MITHEEYSTEDLITLLKCEYLWEEEKKLIIDELENRGIIYLDRIEYLH